MVTCCIFPLLYYRSSSFHLSFSSLCMGSQKHSQHFTSYHRVWLKILDYFLYFHWVQDAEVLKGARLNVTRKIATTCHNNHKVLSGHITSFAEQPRERNTRALPWSQAESSAQARALEQNVMNTTSALKRCQTSATFTNSAAISPTPTGFPKTKPYQTICWQPAPFPFPPWLYIPVSPPCLWLGSSSPMPNSTPPHTSHLQPSPAPSTPCWLNKPTHHHQHPGVRSYCQCLSGCTYVL